MASRSLTSDSDADAGEHAHQPATPVLGYAPLMAPRPRRRRALMIAMLSSPAVVLPFLDFAHSVSPWQAVYELFDNPPNSLDWAIGLVGLSFFAAPLFTAYHFLMLLHPTLAEHFAGCLAELHSGAFFQSLFSLGPRCMTRWTT